MTGRRWPALAFAALLVSLDASPGAAQQSIGMPGMKISETRSPAPYIPGLGELMTAFVQPRHIKLGLAGSKRNWPYAAYELDELSETFNDVAQLVPKLNNLAIPEMIASTVKQPMTALAAAIKAKDATAFTKGYSELTAGCNACHQSTGHPMIVIKAPAAPDFPDQDFRPPPK